MWVGVGVSNASQHQSNRIECRRPQRGGGSGLNQHCRLESNRMQTTMLTGAAANGFIYRTWNTGASSAMLFPRCL